METFSRIVFAIVGLMLGLILGLAIVAVLSMVFMKFNANAQDNPGAIGLIFYFLPVGAFFGALVGLTTGIVLPLRASRKDEERSRVSR